MRPEELTRKCNTVDEARSLIRNARALGNDEVAVASERRLFEWQGSEASRDHGRVRRPVPQ